MISDNPLLGPQWEPLAHVIVKLLENMKRHDTFSAQTYGRKFGLSPDTSPYLQAIFDEEGNLQMEVSGNLQVRPELTKQQMQDLEFYGWEPPETVGGEFGADGNPNFARYFEPNKDRLEIAEFILTTLVGVYGITEDDFWGFERKAELVASLKKLGRLKATEGNPNAVIFAMPGKHFDMVEPHGDKT